MFQKGHKLAPGGPRPNSGRPSTRELKEIARAAKAAQLRLDRKQLKLDESLARIEAIYVAMALDKRHERSTIHAMENYVRPVSHAEQAATIIHQFIQFGANPPGSPTELPPIEVQPTNDSESAVKIEMPAWTKGKEG